jgi:hypothetical protein
MSKTIFKLVHEITSANVYEAPGVSRTLLIWPSQGGRPPEIDPADAMRASMGAFCFVPHLPNDPSHLAETVIHHVNLARRYNYLFWVANPDASTSTDLTFVSASDAQLHDPFELRFRNAKLVLPAHTGLTVNAAGDGFTFSGSMQLVPDADAKAAVPVSTVEMPYSVTAQGLVLFDVALTAAALDGLDVGLRFFWGRNDGAGVRSVRYPVFSLADGETLALQASFDPFEQTDRTRTYYAFTPAAAAPAPSVGTCYRTATGAQVRLAPHFDPQEGGPQLEFVPLPASRSHPADPGPAYLTPRGEFLLDAPTGPDGTSADLLCGLLGTELLTFTPGRDAASGTRLRFAWQRQADETQQPMPAFVAQFPLPVASPVGPPVEPTAALLDATYTTSWVSLLAPSADRPVAYGAQPVGASLFGYDHVVAPDSDTLFGHMDPGRTLPADEPPLLPLVPYAGVVAANCDASPGEVEALERLVIGPTRQRVIDGAGGGACASTRGATAGTGAGDSYVATTPSGMLTEVTCDGRECSYTRIVLAQTAAPGIEHLAFASPAPALQEAFRSNQLCLVVANARNLVREGGEFSNRLDVEGWGLEADVGTSPGYGDYANVLIVKQITGPLYDPDGAPADNLVGSPQNWTQSASFAAPTIEDSRDGPDEGQLVALSTWLEDYFETAARQEGVEGFAHFNEIARDPNWTGILVLRAKIAEVPGDLAGITAGISDMSHFYAHHLGIEINPIGYQDDERGKPIGIRGQSSLFGLIHYVDPDYVEPQASQPPSPVSPPPDRDYDFRVLTLTVLFENTAVKDFASTAQITLKRILAAPVDRMGKGQRYDTIVLRGSYQNNHGVPVYSLGSDEDWRFYFDSQVVKKIEIVSARMNTRDAGGTAKPVEIWFGFAGFIDYLPLARAGSDGRAIIDLFSFGNDRDEDLPRKGLAFEDMGLRMTFDRSEPAARAFEFVASEIRFDLDTSTPRDGSLYREFALTLDGFVIGSEESGPQQTGYLDVITDLPLTAVGGTSWHGLDFRLNMGSPGALAGDVGLTSHMLLAWSPASGSADSVPAAVGLALPGAGGGAKLISLQNVLTLSIGLVKLAYDEKHAGFVLMLTDIALRFLGLLKIPPNGATNFYLFGDPQGTDRGSGLGWYAIYKGKSTEHDESAHAPD